MSLIPDIRNDVLEKTVARARERNILLPTFAQQKDPTQVPAAISARLKDVGLWDMDPANLFRITWKNEAVAHGGGFGEGNWIEFPTRLVPRTVVWSRASSRAISTLRRRKLYGRRPATTVAAVPTTVPCWPAPPWPSFPRE
jgi:hypothetical protein